MSPENEDTHPCANTRDRAQPSEMVKCDWCGQMVEATADVFCETGFSVTQLPEEGEEWKGEEATKLDPHAFSPEHREQMKAEMAITDAELDELLANGSVAGLGGIVCTACQDASLEGDGL